VVRRPLYGAFARVYDVALAEAELPLEDYPTFGAFFARRLKPGSRQDDAPADEVISPCDGVLGARGEVGAGRLIQAKGRDYALADLVASEDLGRELEGGTYLTFYLSPRDYHRVHSPISGELVGYDWIPGAHIPVSPRFTRNVDGVFAANERVVFHLTTAVGPVAVVMVAALGVGNIAVNAAKLHSRALRPTRRVHRVRFETPVAAPRGAELGAFHLGSTVILLFAPDAVTLAEPGDESLEVRLGETMATLDRRVGDERRSVR
jgi:phosphatidylserine decarboxylase